MKSTPPPQTIVLVYWMDKQPSKTDIIARLTRLVTLLKRGGRENCQFNRITCCLVQTRRETFCLEKLHSLQYVIWYCENFYLQFAFFHNHKVAILSNCTIRLKTKLFGCYEDLNDFECKALQSIEFWNFKGKRMIFPKFTT